MTNPEIRPGPALVGAVYAPVGRYLGFLPLVARGTVLELASPSDWTWEPLETDPARSVARKFRICRRLMSGVPQTGTPYRFYRWELTGEENIGDLIRLNGFIPSRSFLRDHLRTCARCNVDVIPDASGRPQACLDAVVGAPGQGLGQRSFCPLLCRRCWTNQLMHPPYDAPGSVTVGHSTVRVADEVRVTYDFNRDGWSPSEGP